MKKSIVWAGFFLLVALLGISGCSGSDEPEEFYEEIADEPPLMYPEPGQSWAEFNAHVQNWGAAETVALKEKGYFKGTRYKMSEHAVDAWGSYNAVERVVLFNAASFFDEDLPEGDAKTIAAAAVHRYHVGAEEPEIKEITAERAGSTGYVASYTPDGMNTFLIYTEQYDDNGPKVMLEMLSVDPEVLAEKTLDLRILMEMGQSAAVQEEVFEKKYSHARIQMFKAFLDID